MTKLIIDADPGVDDAMAILYAAAHPGLELIGLTSVFGNVPVATATRNALSLVELAGLDIPVAEGAAEPRVQPLRPHPDFVHGIEGFGHLPRMRPATSADWRPAAQYLCEECAANPGQITICAIGPLTNLAAALEHGPSIAKNAAQVIVMGGALETPGNVNDHAEANIWNDPHAAAEVFAAGWPVTLVGLDITEIVNCGPADFATAAQESPVIGGFLNDAVQFYFDFHRARHDIDGCHMHDPTAVIALTDPGLFEYREAPVRVTLDGEAAGRTAFGGDGPAIRVAMGVETQSVLAQFLGTIGQADAALGLRHD